MQRGSVCWLGTGAAGVVAGWLGSEAGVGGPECIGVGQGEAGAPRCCCWLLQRELLLLTEPGLARASRLFNDAGRFSLYGTNVLAVRVAFTPHTASLAVLVPVQEYAVFVLCGVVQRLRHV